ncbi:PiggyBac transposable element-derived protein 4 [Araneus ventricosus]|uniref:PiggyBac transposable element-derived protein 4 n=1 Tax=Araneus ventricosus TaxID=182803 RepID=A0A4Y2FI04_ARAVE|nr:PiggyBac transposable element-derived protein 4 [Araneus ventricosus]
MKFLHFTNNEEFDKDNHPWPKLNKIYDIMEHLRNKFRNLYIPDKNLSIDESLMRFKGRLSWKMFIAKKRARFGLKFFVVCEVGTGYIADFLIYTGNGTVYNPKFAKYPVSTKIVLHLMDRFLGQGYCVTMDNYYMSPQLADILISERTDLYGTVNKMRKDLPPNFAKEKIPKGDVLAYQRGKVMALKWQDKKSVFLMSTVHNASSRLVKCKSKKTVLKPIVVCDYNNTMGGVDLCDQEMSYYPTLRKQQGKYIKIFRQFMDQSLWNAYILYKKDNPLQNITLLDFRLQIIELSIQKYSDRNSSVHSSRCSSTLNPMRLTARHFASHIPQIPSRKSLVDSVLSVVQKKLKAEKKFEKKREFGEKIARSDFASSLVSKFIIQNFISNKCFVTRFETRSEPAAHELGRDREPRCGYSSPGLLPGEMRAGDKKKTISKFREHNDIVSSCMEQIT